MISSVDFTGHICQKATPQINRICRPLFEKSGVTIFRYLRLFNDGSRVTLHSHPEVLRYLYKENHYINAWYDTGMPPVAKAGWHTWATLATFNNRQQKEMDGEIAERFGISHGMHLMKIYEDSYEVFIFSSPLVNIYLEDLSLFNRFIFYFKEQARDILARSLKDKIILPLPHKKIIYKHTFSDQERSFPVKHYLLNEKNHDVYLTDLEIKIMQLCSFGNSAKEIAIDLGVSHRTIEHQIEHVKKKLRCSKLSKLLHFLRECEAVK